jgi:predicted acetyltransferase
MPIELRPITEAEARAFMRVTHLAFSTRPSEDDLASRRAVLELDRGLAAFDGDELVATAGACTLELTVPGGRFLPAAGVTWVGVAPTHRRRGILRALMARQLDDIAARGELVAILLASESSIYGRFGYGMVAGASDYTLERSYARLASVPDVAGRVRVIEHAQALEILPTIYDQWRLQQSGAINRASARWGELLHHPDVPMDGYGPRFYAVYNSSADEPRGALFYRVKLQWENGIARNEMQLHELFALDTEAYAALWNYLLGVDLIQTIRVPRRPLDEPLRFMLSDPRRLQTVAQRDDLWLRLLDVETALAARTYAIAGRVVFEIGDAFRPQAAGRYALEGGPDGARCRRTKAEPDLALDVADLGAAYLGGVSFATLARAGRVRELRTGALVRADVLFHTEPAPYCGTSF